MAKVRRGKSRLYTEAIMAHQGYGSVTIHKNGFKITIPQSFITASGAIIPGIRAQLNNLTVDNVTTLQEKYGLTIETA